MVTTTDEIRNWLKRGKEEGATHVIVVCDTFDNDCYPVMVMPGKDVRKKAKEYDDVNMQKIMEVYDLSKDIEEQIREKWSLNY